MRFYSSVRSDTGKKGETTSGGHKTMEAHIRGWGIGARVVLDVDDQGRDRVTVYRTGGSGGNQPEVLIYRGTEQEGAL